MSEVAVIGESCRVVGFRLAGVRVYCAEDGAQAVTAWRGLPAAVCVVILTPSAQAAIGDELAAAGSPLTVVMPG